VFDPGALWTYLTVFCLLTAAGIGFPIPEEVPIVGAGVLVGHASSQEVPPQIDYAAAMFAVSPDGPFPANVPWIALAVQAHPQVVPVPEPPHWWTRSVPVRWWIMLPVCIIGVVVCDGMLYGSGRLWGPWLLRQRFMQRIIPPERREKIEKNFHDYGVWVLLFARLTPTIRAPIFIIAGVIRLPFSKFLMADGLYAIPGVSVLFFLGYGFGEQFIRLIMAFEGRVNAARPIIILAIVAAIGTYLVIHFWRHPWATGDPKQEVPLIGQKVAEKLSHSELNFAQKKAADTGVEISEPCQSVSGNGPPAAGDDSQTTVQGNGEPAQHSAGHAETTANQSLGENVPSPSEPRK
jgi:membrane protein DedA with SNARE-associated domain